MCSTVAVLFLEKDASSSLLWFLGDVRRVEVVHEEDEIGEVHEERPVEVVVGHVAMAALPHLKVHPYISGQPNHHL